MRAHLVRRWGGSLRWFSSCVRLRRTPDGSRPGLIPRPRQREKTRRRVVSSRPVRLKMSEVYSTPVHDSPESQEVSVDTLAQEEIDGMQSRLWLQHPLTRTFILTIQIVTTAKSHEHVGRFALMSIRTPKLARVLAKTLRRLSAVKRAGSQGSRHIRLL